LIFVEVLLMAQIELTDLSLTEASNLLEARKVSPLDLTQACIDRAEALEPKLNAYFTRTFDTALGEAKAATAEIAAGKRRGSLHGVPFALKDLYETAGVRTTAGSPVRENFVPEEDAHVVALLKEAGTVLLGKLNMHEWALGGTNVNVFYPTPRNPWDAERVTGGSSGGSGVAVAAGYCFGALGSDTRGSIRIPAALCGITGLKPTYGRVSLRGVIPLSWSLDHAGPMARTASDCAHILNAIAGWDPRDPTSIDAPAPDYTGYLLPDMKGLRIGVPTNFFFDSDVVDSEISAAVLSTRKVFESLGAEVTEVEFPTPMEMAATGAMLAEAVAYHEQNLTDQPDKYAPPIRQRLLDGRSITGAAYARQRYGQLELQLKVRLLLREIDLLLTPTSPVPPMPIGEVDASDPLLSRMASTALLARNTSPFNVAGIPTISVPCGFDSRSLPIGLQLAGRWWEEGTVLRAAHAYQQVTDWHKKRPPLS
jgi:aspartyl-tRNA(Asn)/glutamyl-tRNA(Gln) amidotransferase subunit A